MKTKRYYLVDLENVGNKGLSAENTKLNSNDIVIIGYTAYKEQVNCESIKSLSGAVVAATKAEIGNQSLDKHLCFVLGYLIGMATNDNKKVQYEFAIISKDNGFISLVDTCNNIGFRCVRAASVGQAKLLLIREIGENDIEEVVADDEFMDFP